MLINRIKPWELLHKALPASRLDTFGFTVPMEIVKAYAGNGKRPVRGVASTPDQDLQEEDVVQNGLDTRYFLKHGYYNDDHKPGAENKVGQPTIATIKSIKTRDGKASTGLWTEGFVWRKGLHKGADSLWELTKALEGSDSDRRMGFSIQGKVLKRDGKRIVKAWIQDIAITPSPINTSTWMELVDDLGKSVWANANDVMDLRKCIGAPDLFKGNPLMDLQGWEELKKEDDAEEGLKAMAAQSNPLVPQSLEGSLKITTHSTGGRRKKKDEDDEVSKALRFCYQLARQKGWSATHSRALALSTVTSMVLS